MKNKSLIIIGLVAAFLIALIVGISTDQPLDPAVEEDLAFRPPEVPPEKNAYIGVSGLGDLGAEDLVAAGLKYLEGSPPDPGGPNQNPSVDFSYKNPCLIGEAADCLDKLAAEAPIIDQAVLKNAELISRYRLIQNMPFYVNPSVNFSDRVPRYQFLRQTANLIGAETLKKIKLNGLSAGLDDLAADLDFYKRMSQSEFISLLDLMIAIAAVNQNLIGLSKIIGDPQIDITGHEERLRQMLILNFDAGPMMAAALTTEKRQFLKFFDHSLKSLSGQDLSWREKLKVNFYLFFLKKNMTLNEIAARYDRRISLINTSALPDFPAFLARQPADAEAGSPDLNVKELFKKYGLFFFKNYTGEILINTAQPDFMVYTARINDTIVLAHLVRAQLDLRHKTDQGDDIGQALTHLGPESRNPYTGRPFELDREKNVLWAERASMVGRTESSGGRMEVGLTPND